MQILVTKRNGNIENYDVSKIKRMIDWACQGLGVNPLALESKFDEFLSTELSTNKVQENLITAARMLANAADPEWTVVAGRLWTMNLWKERGAYEHDLESFVTKQILIGEYRGELIQKVTETYSQEDFAHLNTLIDKYKDLNHSYGSILTAVNKYLTKSETIQMMHMVNAMIIATQDDNPVEFAEELYHALSDRKLSLATPWLGNLRSGGNISSCFIIAPEDDLGSIFDNIKNSALISKSGGGLGIFVGRLRGSGASIDGRENSAKGIFPWVRLFNDTAVGVDQGGKRKGAFTIAIPDWHVDSEEFLEIQSETGDPRFKAYDIFPQIAVHDYLMELDDKDGSSPWHTFCPFEIKEVMGFDLNDYFGKEFRKHYRQCVKAFESGKLTNVKVYKVREFIKKIMRPQFNSGLPYTFFIDTANLDNPNDHIGSIPCGNLCQESFSTVIPDDLAHSCNLASVVVGRCADHDEIEYIASLATRVLDYGIDITTNPIEESGKHNTLLRTIGVGIQGLCDWFAKIGTDYRNHNEAGRVMESIQFGAVKTSIALAKERGAYPAYDGSRWERGIQLDKHSKNKKNVRDWESLRPDLEQYGIRNSQVTSPAPNTTTSVFMDAGAGVMPAYGGFYQKDNGNGMFPFMSMYFVQNPLFYAKTPHRYEMEDLVACVAEIQKNTCAGVSTEYFFDHNKPDFSATSLYKLIKTAWRMRTKAIYYIRHIKKGKSFDDTVSISQVACEGCAG